MNRRLRLGFDVFGTSMEGVEHMNGKMKKEHAGMFWTGKIPGGPNWNGFDWEDQASHAFGLFDLWTGMFMICLAYNGSMSHLLRWFGACVLAKNVF